MNNQKTRTKHFYKAMGAVIAVIGVGSIVSSFVPESNYRNRYAKGSSYTPPAPITINNWAEKGDALAAKGLYRQAYQAYMARCNSSEGTNNMRMAGCGAGYDLRSKAKRLGLDTSNW